MSNSILSISAHRFQLRIYWEDTDASGIVYNANYFKFMERARTELLREKGHVQSLMVQEHGQFFVVGEVHARYLAPARLDDTLIVETAVLKMGSASVQLQHNILKRVDQDEVLLLKGSATLVYITDKGKSCRIPDVIRQDFIPYLKT